MKLKSHTFRFVSLFILSVYFFGSGSFANDTQVFVIAKERIFQQMDASGPAAVAEEYLLFGVVLASESGNILSASINHPDQTLIELQDEGDEWVTEREFADSNALDSEFPDGIYTFNITGASDGAKSIPLNLSGDYLEPLLINNYSALQAIDPTQAVTIQWTAPEGASAHDFILIYVEGCDDDDEFESPLPWETGGLNGLATQFTIPAGVLNPGTVYSVDGGYFRVVDQNPMDGQDYPGVYGIAAFATNLEFNIRTTGESDGLCGANLHLVAGTDGQMLARNADVVTANIHYPVNFNYSLSLNVRDPQPAAYQEVYFSGPAGSGINHVQAIWGGGDSSSYGSPIYNIPPYPVSGEYRVSYRGNELGQHIDVSLLEAKSVVIVPVFNLSAGKITTVELTYRHAQTGAVVALDGIFDNAHISFNLTSGENIYRNFNPINSVINLSDLNISWDSIAYNIHLNLNTENLGIFTSFQIPDEHHTWAGYPIQGDGKVYTEGLMGWIFVFQQPWIFSYDLDNWVYTHPHYVQSDGMWVWVLNNAAGMVSSHTGSWSPWPHLGNSTWVDTGKFLRRIDTRHGESIWSEALNSWLHIPSETFTNGAWVFVYKMD